MLYRMLGGLLGWVVALLPLAAVNLANLAALFSFQEEVLAGGLAIVIGLLLGGATAGLVGGRQRSAYQGGAVGGAAAGGFAALLYLATLFVLLALASFANSEPLLLQDGLLGALWTLTALAFVALLFVACATAGGALAGRRAPKARRVPGSAMHGSTTARQPIPPRIAPGQPLRLPSHPTSSRPAMPHSHSPAPNAYPPAPRLPATPPRPRKQ